MMMMLLILCITLCISLCISLKITMNSNKNVAIIGLAGDNIYIEQCCYEYTNI